MTQMRFAVMPFIHHSAFIIHHLFMLTNNRGSEASEKVVVLAIVAATVLTILYTIYTTLGTRLTDLLNSL